MRASRSRSGKRWRRPVLRSCRVRSKPPPVVQAANGYFVVKHFRALSSCSSRYQASRLIRIPAASFASDISSP